MKKTVALATAILLLLSFTACTAPPASSTAPPTGSVPPVSLPAASSAPGTVSEPFPDTTVEFLYGDLNDIFPANQDVMKNGSAITLEGNTLYYLLKQGTYHELHKTDLATGTGTILYKTDTEPLDSFLIVDDTTVLLFLPSTNEDVWMAQTTHEVLSLDLTTGTVTPFWQRYALEKYDISQITYTNGIFYVMQRTDGAYDSHRLSVIDRSGKISIIAEDIADGFSVDGGNVYFSVSTGYRTSAVYAANAQNPAPMELLRISNSIFNPSVVGRKFLFYYQTDSDWTCTCIDLAGKTTIFEFPG